MTINDLTNPALFDQFSYLTEYENISKNRRKIYCSEACAHRESVAAYRERRRKQPA